MIICLLRVLRDSWLCSPVVEIGLFQSLIDGERGVGEIVKFNLRGCVGGYVLAASCKSGGSGTTWRAA